MSTFHSQFRPIKTHLWRSCFQPQCFHKWNSRGEINFPKDPRGYDPLGRVQDLLGLHAGDSDLKVRTLFYTVYILFYTVHKRSREYIVNKFF